MSSASRLSGFSCFFTTYIIEQPFIFAFIIMMIYSLSNDSDNRGYTWYFNWLMNKELPNKILFLSILIDYTQNIFIRYIKSYTKVVLIKFIYYFIVT